MRWPQRMTIGGVRQPFHVSVVLLVAAWCCGPAGCVPTARAQSIAGGIEGRVLDNEGAAVLAKVVATSPSLQGRRSTVTDAHGRFRMEPLPLGRFVLTISAIGWRTTTLPDVAVTLGVVNDVGDVRLEIEAIPVSGTTASAARSGAHRTSTTVGGSITRAQLKALPTDRDYLSIVALLPHADISYFGDRLNVGGTTGAETDFFVDGMRLNEPPGNATSTSLPYNLVEEVQVLAGGHDAEHGGAGGGLVNAVTTSCSNEFTGQAFGFFANRALSVASGGPSVSARTEDYRSWDAGVNAGLPLLRDRLWLLLAWNPAYEREDVVLPGFGSQPDQRGAQRFAARLTWRVSDVTTASLSAIGDPSHRDQVGGISLSRLQSLASLDPVLVERHGGGWGASGHVTRLLGPRAFLEVMGSLTRSAYDESPVTSQGATDPLYVDETGYVEGGVGQIVDRDAGRSSASATLSAQWHAHTLKTGVLYEDAFFHEYFNVNVVFRRTPTVFEQLTIGPRTSANHTRVPVAFVQDAWAVTSALRVNAGLRWAREYWMASGGDLGQRVNDAWQPRLGATWAMDKWGISSVFASAGRFHQQTRLNVPGVFQQDTPSAYIVRRYDHDPRVDPSGGVTAAYFLIDRKPAVQDLRAAAFDELQLGAESRIGGWTASVRGLQRTQVDAIVGVLVNRQPVYGNPGRGDLAGYPGIEHVYRALELSATGSAHAIGSVSASYVWSSLRGNYEGYWDQSAAQNDPVGAGSFMLDPSLAPLGSGPLPGDRTHRLKVLASRPLYRGVEIGTTFVWESGTPLSALGATGLGAPYYVLLEPRGSRGRTPALYDWNARLSFQVPIRSGALRPRFLLDVYHLGNPRRPVFVDQVRYLAVDAAGQPITTNPSFMKPLLYQPPVAYRFGVEVDW